MAETALRPYLSKGQITIFDPACGSGIFLCEALYSLRRAEYRGHIQLIGCDISENAIQMARFVLKECDEIGDADVILKRQDFFTSNSLQATAADVVLMNPPFVSFNALAPEQQELMRERLGSVRYRPDFSILFAHEALHVLAAQGTIACLLPAGALSSRWTSEWRHNLARDNTIRLLGVLGDHGLFKNAMVNATIFILRKMPPHGESTTTMLWASQHPGAGAAALRGLRRLLEEGTPPSGQADWTLYTVGQNELLENANWLPAPNALGPLKKQLEASVRSRIGELFVIELGIRAGDRRLFVVPQSFINRLSASERSYFRPIAEKSSISNGRISPKRWLFYPGVPMTIKEIAESCPQYYRMYIAPKEYSPDHVLELARARKQTYTSSTSRIVSRAFATIGGFAVDEDAKHVVVQGYAWLPTKSLRETVEDIDLILQDYCFIFNSRIFGLLAREYGQLQSGGQTDLAQKFMKHVPMPHLPTLYAQRPTVPRLAERLRALDTVKFPDVSELDTFAAAVFDTTPSDWPAIHDAP